MRLSSLIREEGSGIEDAIRVEGALDAAKQADAPCPEFPLRIPRLEAAHAVIRAEVPALGIRLSLLNPRQIGASRQTNGAGAVQWVLPAPDGSSGRDLWTQAVQLENASNVSANTIN